MKMWLMLALLANDGTALQLRGPYLLTRRECDALAEITAKLYTIPPVPNGYPQGVKVVQCFPWKGRQA